MVPRAASMSPGLSQPKNTLPLLSIRIVRTFLSVTLTSETEPGVTTLTASFFTNVDVNMKNVSSKTITSLIGVMSIQMDCLLIFTLPIVIKI
ncbi:unknown [Prevotella sp. CAG:1124]|nr:unknown [Prevotella sp. CAG:1124]